MESNNDSDVSPTSSPGPSQSTNPNASGGHGERSPLILNEVCVGSIVWLPHYVEGSPRTVCQISRVPLSDEGYGHPALILNVLRGEQSHVVSIALVTSFRSSLSLSEYLKVRGIKRKYDFALPILSRTTAKDCPASIPSVLIARKRTLAGRKQSYVKTSNIYDVPISTLRSYTVHPRSHAYSFRIDEESYGNLMRLMNREPETYPKHNEIREFNNARLQALGIENLDDAAESPAEMVSESGPNHMNEVAVPNMIPQQGHHNSAISVPHVDDSTSWMNLGRHFNPFNYLSSTPQPSQPYYGTVQPQDSNNLPYPATHTPHRYRRCSYCRIFTFSFVLGILLFLLPLESFVSGAEHESFH